MEQTTISFFKNNFQLNKLAWAEMLVIPKKYCLVQLELKSLLYIT